MTDLTALTTDTTKAVEALPIITNAIAQVQSDLTDGQHKTVLQQTANILNIATQSAQALGTQGLISPVEANQVETGVSLASNGLGIVGEIEELSKKIEDFLKKILWKSKIYSV